MLREGVRKEAPGVAQPEEANAGGRLQCWNLRSEWSKDEAFWMRTRVDVKWGPSGAPESAVMRKGLFLLKQLDMVEELTLKIQIEN